VEGIEKIPPGYWLAWHRGEIHSEAYWNLPFIPPRQLTMDAAKEELDSVLEQAVCEHLLSDVPLGVWLSGGIDSSTILHYAAKASSSRLKTLSISFQGRAFDETPYIREIAALYGTDHEQFDLNPRENLAGAIEEFAYYSDEPTADAGALPVWFLSKMSKRKVTVTLSGEGGDEVFGGYLTYRANRLAEIASYFPSAAIRVALAATSHWPVSDEKISFEYKLKRFLEGCLLPPDQAHIYWNGTFSEEQKKALLCSPLPDSLEHTLHALRERSLQRDNLAAYLWFDQKYFLPDDILNKVDRMSMAHALEVRPPFLDHRIVEFCASLPATFKVRGARQKVILKELMKDKLPASVLTKKKTGLDIPSHEWLRGPLRALMLNTLNDGVADHPGLFKKGAIDRYVSAHLERRANLGYHLWGLMILFLWMRKWRIQTEPLSAPNPRSAESVLTST
jgi:asparagine synthase (glutamine-hydrolysing)